ncbi:hypothetical protein [Variovorax paradoxus]|uniref:hypothetical protein n=1 Tax=Variovorax paradoxus TaxID=34073 RepID=UPI0029C977F2|nr:hypothetical protein [Variovorax paradoxus]WPH20792.1 hypothetical protein RZE78_01205 [Variovorax paradoxus]
MSKSDHPSPLSVLNQQLGTVGGVVDLPAIRKTIGDAVLNTATDQYFHSDWKTLTERSGAELSHHRIGQGLFLNPKGKLYLAFWGKPLWNEASLRFEYVEDASLLEPEDAIRWMRSYCPDRIVQLESALSAEKFVTTQSVTLRMNTELRDYLALAGEGSLNKNCISFIASGIATMHAKSNLSLPSSLTALVMPDGEFALDELERARKFADPDEQALAESAATLYALFRWDYPQFLPYALHQLYRLLGIQKNPEYALCFARWLSSFHRATFEDAKEHSLRNPPAFKESVGSKWSDRKTSAEPKT